MLACPVKANPPNWQHGRVIYALAREQLDDGSGGSGCFLDIGTAKGFSAVVMSWALADAGVHREVHSVDVMNPLERVSRNSVAEAEGDLLTVPEFVAPFIAPTVPVHFHGGGSLALLKDMVRLGLTVKFVFVDGKHSYGAVTEEIACLLQLQRPGAIALFDDMQIPGVAEAVKRARGYEVSRVRAGVGREYAVAVRV